MKIFRGDVVWARLKPVQGSEQGGIRPVVIIQNDDSNEYSPTTIIAPFTSKIYVREFMTNVFVDKMKSGLEKDSTIMFNQIRTIDKSRIIKKIGSLNFETMKKVDEAISISLGLN